QPHQSMDSELDTYIKNKKRKRPTRNFGLFFFMFVGLEDSLRGKGERAKINCSPNLSTDNPSYLLVFILFFFFYLHHLMVRGL
ncbi:MAG: hypothetical protein FWF27_03930, partial [Candidatus Bathyarchaeota archaeon]|nr:hypothetical protein [Candidatus Termiticorpusculum sp.]